MLARWFIGFFIGTALVAVTSPCFVRSYVPRVMDPTRGVPVLLPFSDYRWRSEGYATTRLGPLGMPGQPVRPTRDDGKLHVALWGDSQAEGVCVADDEKIAAHVARLSENEWTVFPMARSGDDCNDWIRQIKSIETSSDPAPTIDVHAFLLVEWSDWCVAVEAPKETEPGTVNRLAGLAPAFVIHAARNLLTSGDGNQLRTMRFRPGPTPAVPVAAISARATAGPRRFTQDLQGLSKQLNRLRRQTEKPCLFLYAPLVPSIESGQIRLDDPDEPLFREFDSLCKELDFRVIDLRGELNSSVQQGRWPRGFHNGQFGVGHYNATGNRLIAQAMVAAGAGDGFGKALSKD